MHACVHTQTHTQNFLKYALVHFYMQNLKSTTPIKTHFRVKDWNGADENKRAHEH